MSALLFLGIALVLSLAGFLVLWMRNRPPRSVDAHIRAFARELEALAPEPPMAPRPLTPRPLTPRPTTALPMAPRSSAPRSTSSRPTAPPAGHTQQPKAPPRRGRRPG